MWLYFSHPIIYNFICDYNFHIDHIRKQTYIYNNIVYWGCIVIRGTVAPLYFHNNGSHIDFRFHTYDNRVYWGHTAIYGKVPWPRKSMQPYHSAHASSYSFSSCSPACNMHCKIWYESLKETYPASSWETNS